MIVSEPGVSISRDLAGAVRRAAAARGRPVSLVEVMDALDVEDYWESALYGECSQILHRHGDVRFAVAPEPRAAG